MQVSKIQHDHYFKRTQYLGLICQIVNNSYVLTLICIYITKSQSIRSTTKCTAWCNCIYMCIVYTCACARARRLYWKKWFTTLCIVSQSERMWNKNLSTRTPIYILWWTKTMVQDYGTKTLYRRFTSCYFHLDDFCNQANHRCPHNNLSFENPLGVFWYPQQQVVTSPTQKPCYKVYVVYVV